MHEEFHSPVFKSQAQYSSPPRVRGAFTDQKKVSLIFETPSGVVALAESRNLIDFELSKRPFSLKQIAHLQLSHLDQGTGALMIRKRGGIFFSRSRDQRRWSRPVPVFKKRTGPGFSSAVIVPDYYWEGCYLMVLGGRSLEFAISHDLENWECNGSVRMEKSLPVGEEYFVDLAEKIDQGILICYRKTITNEIRTHHEVHLMLLDPGNPEQILWRSETPVWESLPEWGASEFGGAVLFRSQLYGFWNTRHFGLMMVRLPIEGLHFQFPKDAFAALEKARTNPMIHPRSDFAWESFATYNPAAFQADGKIHILYRAQGVDLISSIGYANSRDGVNIDERLESPVYLPQAVFESYQRAEVSQVETRYVSGGGIAGCEDPRVTLIEDRVYMTYVAFDGASPPRVALTSIDLQDFLAQRWLWQRPVLISPPGIVDKSAVIFPEKIKGKYVIMHRIFPDILIDSVEDLNFDGTRWLKAEKRICPREIGWDSRKIGAGAPPIKTEEGWLLIYYGVDDRNDRFYKMGAMLLDLEDPSRVLYRSSSPILEPEEWYENSGFKPGIVYPCGAVVMGERVFVYYGGADCVVCVASRNLKEFIEALKSSSELRMESQRSIKVGAYATYPIHV